MGVLTERLDGGAVICAEGYLFELERRGYLQAGAFVPEVVLEHPDAVLQLHREFLRAGSDVSVAFTYYAHREKMRLIGKEHLIESLQKNALALQNKPPKSVAGIPWFAATFVTLTYTTRMTNPHMMKCGACLPSKSAGRRTPGWTLFWWKLCHGTARR